MVAKSTVMLRGHQTIDMGNKIFHLKCFHAMTKHLTLMYYYILILLSIRKETSISFIGRISVQIFLELVCLLQIDKCDTVNIQNEAQ